MMMKIISTKIKGVHKLNSVPFSDKRGTFKNIFRSEDLPLEDIWDGSNINQVNISETDLVGTIRGLHLQKKPDSEYKLIRCIAGEVWDVAVDLRRNSETYCQWIGFILNDNINDAVIIPPGCAHGFQVLQPKSKLLYIHSGHWKKNSEIGYRWNDPKLKINWPLRITEISSRDQNLPYIDCD